MFLVDFVNVFVLLQRTALLNFLVLFIIWYFLILSFFQLVEFALTQNHLRLGHCKASDYYIDQLQEILDYQVSNKIAGIFAEPIQVCHPLFVISLKLGHVACVVQSSFVSKY